MQGVHDIPRGEALTALSVLHNLLSVPYHEIKHVTMPASYFGHNTAQAVAGQAGDTTIPLPPWLRGSDYVYTFPVRSAATYILEIIRCGAVCSGVFCVCKSYYPHFLERTSFLKTPDADKSHKRSTVLSHSHIVLWTMFSLGGCEETRHVWRCLFDSRKLFCALRPNINIYASWSCLLPSPDCKFCPVSTACASTERL